MTKMDNNTFEAVKKIVMCYERLQTAPNSGTYLKREEKLEEALDELREKICQ